MKTITMKMINAARASAELSAIEKMRNIIEWANYQEEHFNFKFKTIADIETAYDYCLLSGWAFLDNIENEEGGAEDLSALSEILGYEL